MSVLVTGGAGYIGGHVVRKLLDTGERVIVIDNLSTGSPLVVPKSVELVVADFSNREMIESIVSTHRVDALVHVAASADAAGSIKDPLRVYENNLLKTHALASMITALGIPHIVFTSSAAVYRETSGIPVTENWPADPITPYGRSKLAVEWLMEDLERSGGPRTVSLRCFNVAGSLLDSDVDVGHRTGHLLDVVARSAVGGSPMFEIFGGDYPTPDGTCIRDFVHATDVADAHVAALCYLRNGGRGRAINCGTGRGHLVLSVIEAFERVTGRALPRQITALRVGDPAAVVADVSASARLLRWTATRSDLDSLILETFDRQRQLVAGDHSSSMVGIGGSTAVGDGAT